MYAGADGRRRGAIVFHGHSMAELSLNIGNNQYGAGLAEELGNVQDTSEHPRFRPVMA